MKQHSGKRGRHEQRRCPQRSRPQKTSVCNKEGLASPTTFKAFGKNPPLSFHDRALETVPGTAGVSLHHGLEERTEQSQPSPRALPQPGPAPAARPSSRSACLGARGPQPSQTHSQALRAPHAAAAAHGGTCRAGRGLLGPWQPRSLCEHSLAPYGCVEARSLSNPMEMSPRDENCSEGLQ